MNNSSNESGGTDPKTKIRQMLERKKLERLSLDVRMNMLNELELQLENEKSKRERKKIREKIEILETINEVEFEKTGNF